MKSKEQTRRAKPLREQLLMWLVCSVIVLIFVVSYALLLRNVSHTVQDTQHLLSVQADTIAMEVGNTLNSYRRLCEVLASNAQVRQFAEYSGTESMDVLIPESYSLSKALSAQLSVYSPDINSAALYFTESGWVVTMARQLEREKADLYFNGFPGLNPEYLAAIPANEHWDIHFADDSDSHYWIIRKIERNARTIGYVIVDYTLDSIADRFSTDRSVLLLGTPKTLLYTSTDAVTAGDYANIYASAAAGNNFRLDGSTLNAAHTSTLLADIQVIAGVPTDRAILVRNVFTTIAIASLILIGLSLGIMVTYLNNRLFQPVERLIQQTNRQEMDSVSALHQIADDYVALQDANRKYIQEQYSIIPLALGRQINHMLETRADDPAVLTYAQSSLLLAGLQPGDGFALFAVCCVEDRKDFFKQMSQDSNFGAKAGAFHFILNNVLTDLLFPDYPGIVAPHRDGWYFVIVTCGSAADVEQIKAVIPTLMDAYEQAFSAALLCTDVTWGNSPENFSISIRAANKELSYLNFWGARAEDPDEDTASFRNYRTATKKLYARLNAQDYQAVPGILDELFEQSLASGKENLAVTKNRLYSLSSIILTSIDEQMGSEVTPEMIHDYEARLLHAESALDIKRELNAILQELDAAQKALKAAESSASRMGEVQKYIRAHFTENELTAAAIAAHFGMNSSYLSRAFKEYSGMNILEYIQRLRVAKAKELLETQRVKDVAQAVGFWDTQGLVRAFKKLEGITPSEYKELHEGTHS